MYMSRMHMRGKISGDGGWVRKPSCSKPKPKEEEETGFIKEKEMKL